MLAKGKMNASSDDKVKIISFTLFSKRLKTPPDVLLERLEPQTPWTQRQRLIISRATSALTTNHYFLVISYLCCHRDIKTDSFLYYWRKTRSRVKWRYWNCRVWVHVCLRTRQKTGDLFSVFDQCVCPTVTLNRFKHW